MGAYNNNNNSQVFFKQVGTHYIYKDRIKAKRREIRRHRKKMMS
jgi:hypothetical protein